MVQKLATVTRANDRWKKFPAFRRLIFTCFDRIISLISDIKSINTSPWASTNPYSVAIGGLLWALIGYRPHQHWEIVGMSLMLWATTQQRNQDRLQMSARRHRGRPKKHTVPVSKDLRITQRTMDSYWKFKDPAHPEQRLLGYLTAFQEHWDNL